MELSRSTVVLFVFLMIIALGAIVVAQQFRRSLTTPAGLRVLSEQRLRNLHAAVHAYRDQHGIWPDSRLSLLRDRRLGLPAAAGIGYRPPEPDAVDTVVIFWREHVLPGAKAGDAWAGPDQPAPRDIPAIGHAITLAGTLQEIPAAEFPQLLAAWTSTAGEASAP